MADLYQTLKGKAYSLATTVSGKNNGDAQVAGFKDVFDYIMSDSDHPRQAAFLMHLHEVLVADHGDIFLDSMAREYAGVADWAAYIERENGPRG